MRPSPRCSRRCAAWAPRLLLAAFTTAAGFYAFIPTQFRGVAELGWIAGTGVFFGFLAATTLLPALVAQFASSLRVQSARTLLDPRIFVPFNRRPRAVLGVAAVVDRRLRRRVAVGLVRQQSDSLARSAQ